MCPSAVDSCMVRRLTRHVRLFSASPRDRRRCSNYHAPRPSVGYVRASGPPAADVEDEWSDGRGGLALVDRRRVHVRPSSRRIMAGDGSHSPTDIQYLTSPDTAVPSLACVLSGRARHSAACNSVQRRRETKTTRCCRLPAAIDETLHYGRKSRLRAVIYCLASTDGK